MNIRPWLSFNQQRVATSPFFSKVKRFLKNVKYESINSKALESWSSDIQAQGHSQGVKRTLFAAHSQVLRFPSIQVFLQLNLIFFNCQNCKHFQLLLAVLLWFSFILLCVSTGTHPDKHPVRFFPAVIQKEFSMFSKVTRSGLQMSGWTLDGSKERWLTLLQFYSGHLDIYIPDLIVLMSTLIPGVNM